MKKRNKSVKVLLVICLLCIAAVGITFAVTVRGGTGEASATTAVIKPTQETKAQAEKTTASPATQAPETSATTEKPVTETSTAAKPTQTTAAATTAPQTTAKPTESRTTTLPTTVRQTTEKAASGSASGRIVVDPTKGQWNLIVVNSTREIPEGYKPKLKEILGCGKYLDYRVAPHYEDMYYAAKKDGITLTPYSAYRTYERQKNNYNNLTNKYMSQYGLSREAAAKKAATVILPPGTSEHNLGLAMDVCNVYDSFANSKEYAWLQKHAHEYGFILRYTKEKQPITGIVPEPWHWRYVGVEYAKKIKDSGLCLEEYLDSIGVKY